MNKDPENEIMYDERPKIHDHGHSHGHSHDHKEEHYEPVCILEKDESF